MNPDWNLFNYSFLKLRVLKRNGKWCIATHYRAILMEFDEWRDAVAMAFRLTFPTIKNWSYGYD